MSQIPSYRTALRTTRSQAIINDVDGGGGAGYVNFYSGTRPATVNDANANTVLGTITLNVPSFTLTGADLVIDITNLTTTAIGGGGDITHARFFDNANTAIIEGDAGVAADNFVRLSQATVADGQEIRVTGGGITSQNV